MRPRGRSRYLPTGIRSPIARNARQQTDRRQAAVMLVENAGIQWDTLTSQVLLNDGKCCASMELEQAPNIRQRLNGQEMPERDAEVARLRQLGESFRVIAKRLGCSVGSVQKAVGRIKRRVQVEQDLDGVSDGLSGRVDDEVPPLGSVRFVGVEERIESFTDERGRRFNLLDLYRHGRIDGGVLFEDACRQLEAASPR